MANVVPWTPRIKEEFKTWSKEQQGKALFLESHPEYPAYLLVNSFDPLYVHVLKDLIGEYRALPKLKLDKLLDAADEAGYEHLFVRDPQELIDFVERLDDPYPYELNMTLKKFQLRGFNFTKDLPSSIINWSTGTGKSVYAVARMKYLLESDQVDKIVVLSKSHNKINWKRTLRKVADLHAVTDDEFSTGSDASAKRENRAQMYLNEPVFIINYEKMKFRPKGSEKPKFDSMGRKRPTPSGDGQELLDALKGKRVLWVWDEVTNKMKSMQTGWYKGAAKLLGATEQNWQIALTARKLDTDPENVYSFVKLMDKSIWPNKDMFRQQYAKRMSAFSPWRVAVWDREKLPELGMRLAHMTHIANKYTDKEIRAEFPKEHWEDVVLDMSGEDFKLYQAVRDEIIKEVGSEKELYSTLMTRLIPLQLVCNNPALINLSDSTIAKTLAAKYKFNDSHCAKLDALKDMLETIDGKIVIFSMFNDFGARMLVPYLTQWGHSFVLYDGTALQKQMAQDRFRENQYIKIFLSGDSGSDSIDLEQATTVINYDLPWNYSTLIQRVNRINRITSDADHVFYYNLIMANTMEERKLKVLEKKRLMEEAIDQPIAETSEMVTQTSASDLRWILDA